MAIKFLSFFFFNVFGKQALLLFIAFFAYAKISYVDKILFELICKALIICQLHKAKKSVFFLHDNYNSVMAASTDVIFAQWFL